MSAPRDDIVFVGHMLDEARKIQQRFAVVNRDEFDADEDLQLATVHDVQRIGEAARRVAPEFREANPQIPWQNIIGMRHRLVHDYIHVDFNVVWEVATEYVLPLISQLNPLVPDEHTDDN